MKVIEGGVCAPLGFSASGIYCGIKKNKQKLDLALITSENLCNAASVYTTNLVKGAPIFVTKENLVNNKAQAIICNSGNANTCNANGVEIANDMCSLVQEYTNISKNDVIVASTGVIGQPLSILPIKNNMQKLVDNLGNTKEHSDNAYYAISTTDTFKKDIAISFLIDGVECKMGGICKGSGMIHPNMATMLSFITTDCNITSEMLNKALKEIVIDTFNMVSVDGDTSTNDMVSILANAKACNKEITFPGLAYIEFKKALYFVMNSLARLIAKDGEGATKVLECVVSNASCDDVARKVAKSVICSSLFKAAMFGSDANWGRVLCAIGYSGCDLDISKIDVAFKSKNGYIDVCKNGASLDFDEELAKNILTTDDIIIEINLNDGEKTKTAYGCDLSYEYVRINGDYRS